MCVHAWDVGEGIGKCVDVWGGLWAGCGCGWVWTLLGCGCTCVSVCVCRVWVYSCTWFFVRLSISCHYKYISLY